MKEVLEFQDATETIAFSKSNGWIAVFQENKQDSDQNIAILEKEKVIQLRDWLNELLSSFDLKAGNKQVT